MPNTAVDLQGFCSVDPKREGITVPWSEGEYSFATDGIVLLRVPRRHDIPERANAPKDVWASCMQGMDQSHFTSLPDLRNVPDFTACPTCHGSGRCHCRECRIPHECGACCGIGELPTHYTQDAHKRFPTWQLRKLTGLPGVQWCLSTSERVFFRFAGGEGIIKARSPEL